MGHFLETVRYWKYVQKTKELTKLLNTYMKQTVMLRSPTQNGVASGMVYFTLYLEEKEHRVSEILILLVYKRIIRHQVSLAPVTLEDF